MSHAALEDAFRESGALVYTLALRSLGSAEEAEDVLRRVMLAAAGSGSGADLGSRALVMDAATRITGDRERRARAKLALLDADDVGVDPVTDVDTVAAEAQRILLRAAVERLAPESRTLLERAFVHGDPRVELAHMTGKSVEEVDLLLADALVGIAGGPGLGEAQVGEEHVAALTLALAAVGGRGEAARIDLAHVRQCGECKAAWRAMNDLVGDLTRLPAMGPPVHPRAGMWAELALAIDAGETVAPEADWRESARLEVERRVRKRTMVMSVAVVLAVLMAGLALYVGQLLMTPVATAVAAATLEDPRTAGAPAGSAQVTAGDDGQFILAVEGPHGEYPDFYLELWVTLPGGEPQSLGPVRGARFEVEMPADLDSPVGVVVEVSREPWDGVSSRTGEVVAAGILAAP